MAIIDPLVAAGGALKRNPIIFILSLVLAIIESILLFVGETWGTVANGLIVVISPFFIGGLLGMATEALNERTHLQTFVHEGASNYLRILAALLLQFGMVIIGTLGYLIIVFILSLLGGLLLDGGGFGLAGGLLGLGLSFGVISLLFTFVLLLLGFVFFFQFYDAAIVISDTGIVDSLKRSMRFVWQNLVSTLGYSIISFSLTGISFLPLVYLFWEMGEPTTTMISPTELLTPKGGLIVTLEILVTTVVHAILSTYRASFYWMHTVKST